MIGKYDNMNYKIAGLLIVLLSCALAGCSTVNPGKHFGETRLDTLTSAYVVRHQKSSWDIDSFIQEALADRGVRASAGPIESKPKDVDFYVEYVDRWQWDMAMYLFALDIRFKSNVDGTLIGTGSFEQGFLHSFPDPKKKTREVIDQIYNAK